jgi:acyl carrier protein
VVLGQYPAVRECVVVMREDTPGEPRLVAYVVPAGDAAAGPGELRGFLHEKLPEHMLPSAFIALPALPLTPSGKVDRHGLPAPALVRPVSGVSFVAPRTPVEEQLAAIWAEALGLEQIGIHDNFLELGGHSLLAVRVISRLQTLFQVSLPLRCLFDAPTVAKMALVLIQHLVVTVGKEEMLHLCAALEALPKDEEHPTIGE